MVPGPAGEAWDRLLSALPDPHLLQSAGWGTFKSKVGWRADRWVWRDESGSPRAAAQVLARRWPSSGGFLSVVYCPRGPVLDWEDDGLARVVLRDLSSLAARRGTVLLKVEPDVPASDAVTSALIDAGWRPSDQPVQFSSTMLLDLRRSDDELLASMKPKWRYNIRLAERRGVTVRPAGRADFDRLYDLYVETSVRDGFVIRPREYYVRAWGDFVDAGLAQPLAAEVAGRTVAGLVAYRFGRRAWYLYGMSGSAHREAMPNHALQWAAIRWARDAGCHTYDFWGAPDALDPADPLWGLYRFKEGFGARHVRLVGSWDVTLRPRLYWAYSVALPRLLAWARGRQQARMRRLVDPGG